MKNAAHMMTRYIDRIRFTSSVNIKQHWCCETGSSGRVLEYQESIKQVQHTHTHTHTHTTQTLSPLVNLTRTSPGHISPQLI